MEDDHCVHVPNLQLIPIRLTNEIMHALLQLAVLHRATIEYVGQMIQNWVNDEWTSLLFIYIK